VDAYRGQVRRYSTNDALDALRKTMLDLNGGSTKLDYKRIRNGKCEGLFSIVEEILARTVVDGFQQDEYFNALVDFRNVAMGDRNAFLIENADLFTVSEAAAGTQGIRRQRLSGVEEITIPTSFKVVKIYEEMGRVLSGQVDFNRFINRVSESFRQHLLDEIYALWNGAQGADLGGGAYFNNAGGAYDEDALLDVIAHAEAAAGGKPATVLGTKKALRRLMPSVQGASSKEDLYTLGYCGKFYGSKVAATPQRHRVGATDFVFDDDSLTILAGDDKPVKCVYEGESTVLMGDPTNNADFTQAFFFAEKYGMALTTSALNGGVGRYEFN
jgi:hypothetical protein